MGASEGSWEERLIPKNRKKDGADLYKECFSGKSDTGIRDPRIKEVTRRADAEITVVGRMMVRRVTFANRSPRRKGIKNGL